MANFLIDEGGDDSRSTEDRNTKKVIFKEHNGDVAVDMVVDLDPILTLSSKDKLLGKCVADFGEVVVGSDGDVTRSTINRIPTIDFSDRIQQILFKEMAMTVVLKLLGHSIGYVSLQNRISSL
ncbi:hypothetical protein GOBAR_DD34464 [Gossypium barbadense]|nr:hypothetical protein GOBAR_DD34464 [Gossypium barbadense]